MAYSILMLRRAQDDLRSITKWLGQRSPLGLARWFDSLEDMLSELAKQPLAYARVTEAEGLPEGIRQTLFRTRRGKVYRVVFLVEQAEVRILRIRAPGQRALRRRDLG